MTKSDGDLRPLFRQHIPQFHWQSIETGGTGRGVPDTNFGAPGGIERWIEFKQTGGWVVTLRPEQVGWHCRRARLGVTTWIAVRRWHAGGVRRGPPADELHLLPGRVAVEAVAGGLRDPVVCRTSLVWAGGPGCWDWDAVADALTR